MRVHPGKPNYELSSARTLQGISAKQVASILKQKTPNQVYLWERGVEVPSLPHALILGHIYNKPVEVLFKQIRQNLITDIESRREAKDEDQRSETVGSRNFERPVDYRSESISVA